MFVQQLNQVFSQWLSLLIDNKDWAEESLSSDISNMLSIYDLILQIVDPCEFITSQLDSTANLYTLPDSVITQNIAVYYS